MTLHRYGYQTDQHRRDADTIAAQRIMERSKQARRNLKEWLRRAKVAIDDGRLDQAIALIEQAKGEVT